MQTKRFIGNDLGRLYRRVRQELGPDALVFSTRSLHRDDGPPLIEIQAGPPMSDNDLPLELQEAMLSTVLSRVAPGMKVPELEDLVLRGVIGPAAAGDLDPYDGSEQLPQQDPEPLGEAHETAQQPNAHKALFEASPQEPEPAPGPVDLLVGAGLAVPQAEAVVARFPGLDPEAALAQYLMNLPVSYPDEHETALVVVDGPHGAGRTTALLRMALDCSEAGRTAIVVASDASHAGTVDRLAGYADAMGLAFVDAFDDRTLEKAIRKARRGAVLFVDTPPGWAPPPFVTAAVYRYMALPAHWQGTSVQSWLQAPGHGPYAGAIPTFTDLATDLSPVVTELVALGTGVAFLSSGSDISSGIEVADARRIASGLFSMATGGRTDGRVFASA